MPYRNYGLTLREYNLYTPVVVGLVAMVRRFFWLFAEVASSVPVAVGIHTAAVAAFQYFLYLWFVSAALRSIRDRGMRCKWVPRGLAQWAANHPVE